MNTFLSIDAVQFCSTFLILSVVTRTSLSFRRNVFLPLSTVCRDPLFPDFESDHADLLTLCLVLARMPSIAGDSRFYMWSLVRTSSFNTGQELNCYYIPSVLILTALLEYNIYLCVQNLLNHCVKPVFRQSTFFA